MKFVRKLTMIEQSTNRTESMFAVCSGVLMYTLDVFTVARVSVDKIVAFCPVQTSDESHSFISVSHKSP